ncbi:WAT1-related protein At3g28050-like isoform X1 [Lycium ferocissimum]|uniref:WAT1-related protein At3g28050-like isoform X1 n=1 Tax=Lycium ferocissimum TaxID=112874 RepID=UPI00281626E2|nr:WAT1-related protein At3g28050-like isoform X1 [Lycium ferocissimum]
MAMEMNIKMKEALPYIGMASTQFAQVGLMIVGKKAMSTGMTNFTFVFYSNALASLILLPSFFFYRSTRPPLNFSLISGFFLLGVLGCSAQLTGYTGINYTSASFASAMLNLIPGFTFILAVIFRMEKLDCRSTSTLIKSVGTIVSIAGAFTATLYKGPQILLTSSSLKPRNYLHFQETDWVIGGLYLVVDCVAASLYLIVQASILKKYPVELIVVFFYCFFSSILSAIVSLFMDRNLNAWMLQPGTRLLAVLYSGIFGSAFQVSVMFWCIRRKGPLFVAMFHPLGIVIAVALGIIFLGDIFYLGSLVGSIIIVVGFYAVMWGKTKEEKVDEDKLARNISSKAPLLQVKDGETRI